MFVCKHCGNIFSENENVIYIKYSYYPAGIHSQRVAGGFLVGNGLVCETCLNLYYPKRKKIRENEYIVEWRK